MSSMRRNGLHGRFLETSAILAPRGTAAGSQVAMRAPSQRWLREPGRRRLRCVPPRGTGLASLRGKRRSPAKLPPNSARSLSLQWENGERLDELRIALRRTQCQSLADPSLRLAASMSPRRRSDWHGRFLEATALLGNRFLSLANS